MSKFYYIVQGFSLISFQQFDCDPGLFETEKEASRFCEQHTNENAVYRYTRMRLGTMNLEEKKSDPPKLVEPEMPPHIYSDKWR